METGYVPHGMINYRTRFRMAEAAPDITEKLLAWRGGRQDALHELLPLVYGELRKLARSQLRRGIEGTLDTGGLVHEAYLRMVDQQCVVWQDRAHFFGLASNLMRSILVDHYRARHAQKRGGDARQVDLEELAESGSLNWREHFLDLDQAMNRLAALDPQQARMVELRFLGGLNIEDTAEVMGRVTGHGEESLEYGARLAAPRVAGRIGTRRTDDVRSGCFFGRDRPDEDAGGRLEIDLLAAKDDYRGKGLPVRRCHCTEAIRV